MTEPGELYVGLMSGTSCDGLDAALLEIEPAAAPHFRLRGYREEAYDPAFRERLLALPNVDVDELIHLHYEIAVRSARAVQRLLRDCEINPEQVRAIGSHGHTVFHQPPVDGQRGATLQIGDGNVLALETGIRTVCDFRTADVAAGGHGAPLVPKGDEILTSRQRKESPLAILNLGGIANLTFFSANQRCAFDVGPGMMVIDSLARWHSNGKVVADIDGELSSRGKVLPTLLADALKHPFLSQAPPKSTGREVFGPDFIDELLRRYGDHAPADLIRTAVEWTATNVIEALKRWCDAGPDVPLWIAGGGARHPLLRQRLEELWSGSVSLLDGALGLPCEAREAVCFAILARETLAERPGNWPEATGAERHVILGKTCVP